MAGLSENIGQQIRELRRQMKLSRSKMADALKISADHLYRIETGKRRPTWELLESIEKVYGVPPSRFIEDPDEDKVKLDDPLLSLATKTLSALDKRTMTPALRKSIEAFIEVAKEHIKEAGGLIIEEEI